MTEDNLPPQHKTPLVPKLTHNDLAQVLKKENITGDIFTISNVKDTKCKKSYLQSLFKSRWVLFCV